MSPASSTATMDTPYRVSLCSTCDRAITRDPAFSPKTQKPNLNSSLAPSSPGLSPSQILGQAELQAREFKKELLQLKITKLKLKQQQRALVAFIDQQRGRVSPIRRLSDELLVMILLDVCRGFDFRFPIRETPPNLAVSQVCRRWRSLVRGHDKFWCYMIVVDVLGVLESTSIDVGEDDDERRIVVEYDERDVVAYEKLLLLEVTRTWSHLVCFDLLLREEHLKSFGGVIAILAREYNRWHCCTLSPDALRAFDGHFLGINESRKPARLEKVTIMADDPPEFPLDGITMFKNAPVLNGWRQLVDNMNSIPALPCWHLTHLATESSWITLAHARTLLTACPALVELNVSLTVPEGTPFPERTPISLPRLRNLELKADNLYIIYYMFWVLTAPRLGSLRLHMGHLEDYRVWLWPLDILDRFLERSGCTIRNFALVDMPIVAFNGSGTYQVLERFSKLKTLEANEIGPGRPEDVLKEVAVQRRTATDYRGAGEWICLPMPMGPRQ
ncbi:uncharacterized protein SCHCODRAFT_02534869 [Schizophyllum commune H4-8]|nr:uncharacterized protein SCHCODRAFT_02534869 [Schizophyllum commune H4-8]KAI5894730.1 hypothetical protein SCHCODRAFT_02534869 [Schizophyllum commune H4-8]